MALTSVQVEGWDEWARYALEGSDRRDRAGGVEGVSGRGSPALRGVLDHCDSVTQGRTGPDASQIMNVYLVPVLYKVHEAVLLNH